MTRVIAFMSTFHKYLFRKLKGPLEFVPIVFNKDYIKKWHNFQENTNLDTFELTY